MRRVVQRRQFIVPADIFPRHQTASDIPGQGGRNQQRDHAAHGAQRQCPARRTDFFGRLAGAFNAQIIPDAEMQRRDHADPAIRQAGQQILMHQHRGRVPRLYPNEQDYDGDEGNRRDDEIHR